MPPSANEIPVVNSAGRDSSRPPLQQLVLKTFREQANDVRKDLEDLQNSFNSLNYSQRSLLSERSQRSLLSERKSSTVSFSTAQVREYNVTLGDYRSGLQCPLTLAWEHGPSRTYDIDTFSKKKRRQHRNPLERLPLHTRQDRLRAMGWSKEEITQTSRKQQRIQMLVLNGACRLRDSSFPGTGTRPQERAAPLYQHGSLKDFQIEDCVASSAYIDMEKIMKARKNASSIEKPIRSKNTNSVIAASSRDASSVCFKPMRTHQHQQLHCRLEQTCI